MRRTAHAVVPTIAARDLGSHHRIAPEQGRCESWQDCFWVDGPVAPTLVGGLRSAHGDVAQDIEVEAVIQVHHGHGDHGLVVLLADLEDRQVGVDPNTVIALLSVADQVLHVAGVGPIGVGLYQREVRVFHGAGSQDEIAAFGAVPVRIVGIEAKLAIVVFRVE